MGETSIKPRPARFDRRHHHSRRTAELSAGDQLVILSVDHHENEGRNGLRLDVSFAFTDEPLVIDAPLGSVRITRSDLAPGGGGFLSAADCVGIVRAIQEELSGESWDSDTIQAIADVITGAGLTIDESET